MLPVVHTCEQSCARLHVFHVREHSRWKIGVKIFLVGRRKRWIELSLPDHPHYLSSLKKKHYQLVELNLDHQYVRSKSLWAIFSHLRQVVQVPVCHICMCNEWWWLSSLERSVWVEEQSQTAARDCIRLPGKQVIQGGDVEVGKLKPNFWRQRRRHWGSWSACVSTVTPCGSNSYRASRDH